MDCGEKHASTTIYSLFYICYIQYLAVCDINIIMNHRGRQGSQKPKYIQFG